MATPIEKIGVDRRSTRFDAQQLRMLIKFHDCYSSVTKKDADARDVTG